MKRQAGIEAGVFVLLVAAGVALRMGFQSIPNFAPVAALALFAGYYFRSRWTAIALPVCVMAITDSMIGAYRPAMMAVVYASLAAPVLFRGVLRRRFAMPGTDASKGDGAQQALRSTAGLVGCSLGASVFFFLTTNFAHWVIFEMYPKTAAGLWNCYVQALPFFKYTLASDLTFACVLFGSYAFVTTLFAETAAAIARREA